MPCDKSKTYIGIKNQYVIEALRVFRKLVFHGKKAAKDREHLYYNTTASDKEYYLQVCNLNPL